MKKHIAALLCIALCICSVIVPVAADDVSMRDVSVQEAYAADLKTLGLFKGVSDTDFDLERAPTRIEALVMLIRVLGKEKEALGGTWTHPFTDVVKWADAYVGYAYETGLTKGVSATEFGNGDASVAMYLTFMLRALGYTDVNNADFSWNDPYTLAKNVGILTDAVNIDTFWRADAVSVSYEALSSNLKGSDTTLADKLIGAGVFTKEQYDAVMGCDEDGDTPIYSSYLDENGFFKGVRALDFVTLPEYKGIEITANMVEPSEEDIQVQIDELLTSYNTYVPITDSNIKIKDGDTVNIDYVGYIDGVAFSGGSTGGFGTDVTIGVTQYIDDFLEQLIGHAPGEKFDIEVTFPENYDNAELNGKDAVFSITVNHIHGDVVKAELTDKIARDYGFNSVEALIADIGDWLVYCERYYFFVDLLEKAVVSTIPSTALEFVIALDVIELDYKASTYGISIEDYLLLYYSCDSIEAYVEKNAQYYVEEASLYLAAQAIAEAENITVSDAQIEAAGYTQYIAEMGKPYVKQYLLFDEVIPAFIAEHGIVK